MSFVIFITIKSKVAIFNMSILKLGLTLSAVYYIFFQQLKVFQILENLQVTLHEKHKSLLQHFLVHFTT